MHGVVHLVLDRRQGEPHRLKPSVRAAALALASPMPGLGGGVPDVRAGGIYKQAGFEGDDGLAQQVFPACLHVLAKRRVGINDQALGVGDEDGIGRTLDDVAGDAQLGLGALALAHLAQQGQCAGGQAVVHFQHGFNQNVGCPAHLLGGERLGLCQGLAALQGQHSAGQVGVVLQNMKRQPVRQERDNLLNRFIVAQGPGNAAHTPYLGHKIKVGLVVGRGHGIVAQVLPPNGFFGLEVVHRIAGQLVKHLKQGQLVGAKGHVPGQRVEQVHQLVVL